MAPVSLAVLAGSRPGSGAFEWRRIAAQPLRTPVVVGWALGLLVSGEGIDLPALVLAPVELVAGLALPVPPRVR